MKETVMHPFDSAIALTRSEDDWFHGQTTPAYWNMVGPFGGITAAALLNAVLQHPDRLGDPTAMTINFAGPVPEGRFRIQARVARTNRSTQHWMIEQWVDEPDGNSSIATTATLVTAVRRTTWSATDCVAPLQGGPTAQQQPIVISNFTPWIKQYTMVPVQGAIPSEWDGRINDNSASLLWVRKTTPRPMDFCSLLATCDVFFPRIWLLRAKQVPAGTVSMTVYFYADQAQLDSVSDAYVLAQARGQEFRNAFTDQAGQLWSQDGRMLATTHQIAYYKE